MSLLEKIENSIKVNTGMVCVHKTEIDRSNGLHLMNTDILNYANFIVAPKKGFALDKSVVDSLQYFMKSLIAPAIFVNTRLMPSDVEDFEQEITQVKVGKKTFKSHLLKVGKLYFKEELEGRLYGNRFIFGSEERGLNKPNYIS